MFSSLLLPQMPSEHTADIKKPELIKGIKKMKKFLYLFFTLVFLFALLFGPFHSVSFSQYAEHSARLKLAKNRFLTPDETLKRLNQLTKKDKKLSVLKNVLENNGFHPQKEAKNLLGTEDIFLNKNREKVIIEVYLQDYLKPGSEDTAALAWVSVSVGKNPVVYPFYLIAPKGNFEKGIEYSVDDDFELYKENRWQSCIKEYFKQKCIASNICILYTRSQSWAPYLLNIAYTCRHCFALSSAFCIGFIQ